MFYLGKILNSFLYIFITLFVLDFSQCSTEIHEEAEEEEFCNVDVLYLKHATQMGDHGKLANH